MNKYTRFVIALLSTALFSGIGMMLAPALASASSISVWWPTNGSTLAATQPFKALVEGAPLATYTMYWQVDHGQLNIMSDNLTDYPHKEASVDVSGWHWSSNGSYLISFVAKDLSGNVIGTADETIYVNVPGVSPTPTATAVIASPTPPPVVTPPPAPVSSPTLSGTGSTVTAVQAVPTPAPIPAASVLAPVITPSVTPTVQTVTPTVAPAESVWWPTPGAVIQGVQPFKAVLANTSLSNYTMYWQVDGGQLNVMTDNLTDYPHKEAEVDVSGWSWHGHGPYALNFVSKNLSGTVIAQQSLTIYNGTTYNGTTGQSVTVMPSPTPALTPLATPIASPTPTPAPQPTLSPIIFGNPLSGFNFYVDPNNEAAQQASSWASSQPVNAALMKKIAVEPVAKWLGDWNSNVYGDTKAYVDSASAAGKVPIIITYNIPNRDCGGYSSGGATSAAAYQSWIQGVANGIGSRSAVVILEPDALPMMDCLSASDATLRYSLLNQAVTTLKANPNTIVYMDAGNSNWIGSATMAQRLTSAGISRADGFSLNVSNYYGTSDLANYGQSISAALGGTHFVVDTSRNGLGPDGSQWCNPPGRALGLRPTIATGNSLIDAFLWLKQPGESDGTCNGGPSAGTWWPDYAVGLSARAAY